MLRETGERDLAADPDQHKSGKDARNDPGKKTAVGFPVTKNPSPVGKRSPEIDGGAPAKQRCSRVRKIGGKHDPERPNQWYYEELNTNNIALQYL
jgi:hypothetical protein